MDTVYLLKLEFIHGHGSLNMFVTKDRKIAEKFIEDTLEHNNYSGLCKYKIEEIIMFDDVNLLSTNYNVGEL